MARCTTRSCGRNFQALNALCMGNYRPSASYSEDALLFFAQLPTQPDANVKSAYNNIFVDYETELALMDIFYWNLSPYEDNKRTTIVNPSLYYQSIIGTPVFKPWKGVYGAAASAYDSGFIPSTHGVNYTLSAASFWFYIAKRRVFENNKYLMGCSVAGEAGLAGARFDTNNPSLFAGVNTYQELNGSMSGQADYWGLWHVKLEGGSLKVYHNGVEKQTLVKAAVALPNCSMYECALNLAGVLTSPSTSFILSSGMGAASIDEVNLYELHEDMIGDLPLYKWYGDSIFEGYGITDEEDTVPYLVSENFERHAYNKAISGTTCKNLVDSGETIARTNNTEDLVFIDFIVNDAIAALGAVTFTADCTTLINRVVAAGCPVERIYWVIPYITDGATLAAWGDYKTALIALAASLGFNLINMSAVPYDLDMAGLHPTEAGSITMANYIIANI